jgi:hypothetical protein
MKFDNLFIEAVNKVNEYLSIFLTLEANPERILIDIFSGESDNLLTRVIESSEELTGEALEVHDLQDELYRVLIPYLQPSLKGLELVYDSNNYPAPIQIFEGNREIGRINIYERVFTVIPHEDLQREEQFLKSLEEQYKENAEEISKFEAFQLDPMAYGDTPMKKVQIALRKNHYDKEIKGKYQNLIELSMELEQSLISQRIRLEKVQEGLQPYEDMQYDIANQFRDKYEYEVKRQEDEE